MNTNMLPDQTMQEKTGGNDGHPLPRLKTTMIYLLGGMFLMIMLLIAVGLGVWSYQLSSRLTATQAQLVTLQGDYGKSKSANTQLITDLGLANSNLDQAKIDLADANAKLETANRKLESTQVQMDLARSLMKVVEGMYVDNENALEIDAKVINTGDDQLISLWKKAALSSNEEDFLAFNQYLFQEISDALN